MLLQKPANVDLPWHGVSLHEIYGESLMINSGHLLLPLALHPLSAEVRIFLTLFLNQSALLQSHTTSWINCHLYRHFALNMNKQILSFSYPPLSIYLYGIKI